MKQKKENQTLPIINLSNYFGGKATEESKRDVVKKWNDAFSTVGFAILINTGVSQHSITALEVSACSFFAQADALKCNYSLVKYGIRSYTPIGLEAVGRSLNTGLIQNIDSIKPDPVESFVFKNGGTPPDFQPEHPMTLVPAVKAYWKEMEILLAERVLPLSAVSLGLPNNYFNKFYQCEGGKLGNNSLRLAYYPALDNGVNNCTTRYGAHTDYMGFTLLRPDPMIAGLEVLYPDGNWVEVPPILGNAIIINSGDLIKRWTNDLWNSALHRVKISSTKSRLSLVFFTGPRDDALVETLSINGASHYAPVLVKDHLNEKIKATNI